jgi:type IV pilus assembly protein PilV
MLFAESSLSTRKAESLSAPSVIAPDVTNMHQTHITHHQRGVSLIEVLVAILVMSLGILAMVAMQVNATKFTKTSEIRTMGALLVGDLADRMRANRDGFNTGAYAYKVAYPNSGSPTLPDVTDTCNKPEPATACSASEMAAKDKADWFATVNSSLPGGTAWIGDVDANTGGIDIWLVWNEPGGTRDAAERNASECPDGLTPPLPVPSDPKAPIVTLATPRCMYFRVNI